MNLTKSFRITQEESRPLKEIVPKGGISYLKKCSEIKDDDVLNFSQLKHTHEEIVSRVLSRIYPNPDIIEAGVFAFGNVGLHVDSIYSEKYVTAVIPVAGYGSLYVTDGKVIKEERIGRSKLGTRDTIAVIFDDRKPHCYMGEGLMLAIICGVRRELLN